MHQNNPDSTIALAGERVDTLAPCDAPSEKVFGRGAFTHAGITYVCEISVKATPDNRTEITFAWNLIPKLPPATRNGSPVWAYFEGEQAWAFATLAAVEMEFGVTAFPSATVADNPEANQRASHRAHVMTIDYWCHTGALRLAVAQPR